MHIILFGGAFNPPHLGHQIVTDQAFELTEADQIWLLPAYRHTFAKQEHFAPVNHRLAMTQMLENNRVKTCTIEIDQQMDGNTIHPVRTLKQKHSHHHFSFLMGSDQLKTFTHWGQWRQLLEEIPFFIYPRVGFPFKPLYHHMTPLKHPLQVVTNISSTMVRHRLEKGLSVKHLVPAKVLAYIKKHHLYPKEAIKKKK